MWVVLDAGGAGKAPQVISAEDINSSPLPSLSVRLLKVNNNCSVEDSEENSEVKDHCSDSKKEVGFLS